MLRLHVRRQDKPGQSEMREFTRPVVTIGRHPDNDLVLPESTISRQHARIEQRDGQWRLLDLGSAHGCYLNKERVQDVVLPDGAEIYLNPFVLTVQIPRAEAASGIDTTASPFDAPKGTVLELQMGPSRISAPPDQPTPAEGTVFELTAGPASPRGHERKTDPIPRGGGRIQPEAEEPTIPPPKSPPTAPEPPVEEGTVFELSAGPVRKALGKEPAAPTPPPAPKAPLPRTPTPPAMPKAPTPHPASPEPSRGAPTPRAATPAPRPAVPPTRMRKKDDGPKAGPEPEAPEPDAEALSPEERLPILIDAHFHGRVMGVLAAAVALLLALIPVPVEGGQVFLWSAAGKPGPLFFWLVAGGALTAVVAGIVASNGTLRGPLYTVAGALPLTYLIIRHPPRESLARFFSTHDPRPGWRSLAVEQVYHLREQAPLWLVLALVGVTATVVAFRLSRLHPESAYTRVLGGLGGACCLAVLLAPAAPILGEGSLAAKLPEALRHSPANAILCVPPFAGLLALTLTTGLGLGPLARLASAVVFGALLLPGLVHAAGGTSLLTLHQGRLALLPVLLFFVATTGLAALLLDVLLGQNPEEQAMLDAL